MKRLAIILAAVCAFALCFALVGCSGGKDQAAPADDQAATEATEAAPDAAAPDAAAPDAATEAQPAAEQPES